MAEILLPQQVYVNKGYVDNTMGPYENIAALGQITNLFVGLTVTVLNPVPMECWLPKRALKSGWRIKKLSSVATYADLESLSDTVLASDMKGLVEKGMEAVVLADETNEGKVTKYIVTEKTSSVITWERQNSYIGVPVDGDDVEE